MKLGITGISEGNGHPYSWAAIFNGYDKHYMSDCEFKTIPNYLAKQPWPESRIAPHEVTHIWTQDIEKSHKIARASKIANVCCQLENMIDQVDAILHARDDAENHLELTSPFLSAGLPVFIDKPISLTIDALHKLLGLQTYPGQIFSASSLSFSEEITLSQEEKEELGEIIQIIGVTPKSWNRYAVHIIDPLINNILRNADIIKKSSDAGRIDGSRKASISWSNDIKTTFISTGQSDGNIIFKYIGKHGHIIKTVTDHFTPFRKMLKYFTDNCLTKSSDDRLTHYEKLVTILQEETKR